MNVAIIGCGSIGARHARNARALGHRVTVYDRDPARGSVLPLAWREQPDAAMICTPARTHGAVAARLAEGGYKGPLFVEKPLAVGRTPPALAGWPHPTTMVGYNLRFHPEALEIKAKRPRNGQLICLCDSRTWPGSGYAGVMEELSHEIDLALWFGADPHVMAASVDEHRAILWLRGGEGDAWLIELNDRAPDYRRRWNVQVAGGYHGAAWNRPEALGEDMYAEEIKHFLAAAATGQGTECPFWKGARVLAVIEQARRVDGRA